MTDTLALAGGLSQYGCYAIIAVLCVVVWQLYTRLSNRIDELNNKLLERETQHNEKYLAVIRDYEAGVKKNTEIMQELVTLLKQCVGIPRPRA